MSCAQVASHGTSTAAPLHAYPMVGGWWGKGYVDPWPTLDRMVEMHFEILTLTRPPRIFLGINM